MSEESIPPMEITPSKDERTWAMLSHFSALCMFIFPFGNILAPLIIWLIKKQTIYKTAIYSYKKCKKIVLCLRI